MKEKIKEYCFIAFGAFLYALGVNYFFVANKLAEGGVTGITLMIYYLTGASVSLTYLLINIPLIIIGWKFLGKDFIYKTLFGTVMVTLGLKLTHNIQGPMDDLILVSIFGGITLGLGLGIIFYCGGSTGGTDILARLLKSYKGIAVGKAMFAMDFVVLCMVAILFGKKIFMFTLIAVFICGKMIDFVQDGFTKAKGVMIITDKAEDIRKVIMNDMGRGVTLLQGRGGYTLESKEVIYCVVSRMELFRLKNIIKNIDQKAFVTVTEVAEVLGEGFQNINQN
ncbi:YitT family protein [Cetobacterium sp. SF1]|uniref:YitT family protein n=1 Tax=unclassified Cetobacterium TaxID=2630983 RepID=UPI003CF8C7C4